jgi:uncharacterized membrane protein
VKIPSCFPTFAASTTTRQRQRWSLLLASVGIALLPLAWRGTSCGHDFDFHLESWMEVVRQWHQGVLYPHWAASANYGAGEPRFVFYPPVSWLLGAALGAALPWTWVPLVFTLMVLAAMGASFFHMAREWMPEDNAVLAACLYVTSPYVLFVAYERTAYGELLAGAWMPLLVLFALRERRSALKLAIVIAGLWLTNAPGAVMGCYALAVLVAWAAIAERRWRLIGRAVGALTLGLGLAAVYLVPALYEQRWVEIKRAIADGMRVEDSFLFEHTGQAFHDQVLRSASWIAVALLTATMLAAAFSYRTKRTSKLREPLVALAIVIACLLLPFSDSVWRFAPELRFLQFPWRWLLVLSLILAALAGLALRGEAITRRYILLRTTAVLVIAFLLSGLAWISFWQPCDEEDNVTAQIASFHDKGFEGTDEYTAIPADNGDIQRGLPPVRIEQTAEGDEADSSVEENPEWRANASDSQLSQIGMQIQIERWQVERVNASVRIPAPGFAVLRVMDYPAWRVRVNGARVDARPRRDDGLMTIPLAAGASEIEVRYGTTRDMWLGRIVSLLAAVLWVALAAFQARQKVS